MRKLLPNFAFYASDSGTEIPPQLGGEAGRRPAKTTADVVEISGNSQIAVDQIQLRGAGVKLVSSCVHNSRQRGRSETGSSYDEPPAARALNRCAIEHPRAGNRIGIER